MLSLEEEVVVVAPAVDPEEDQAVEELARSWCPLRYEPNDRESAC